MYLIDTNVISELRWTGSSRGDANVIRWGSSVSSRYLYLSVMTLFELEFGILRLDRYDKIQSGVLRKWVDGSILPAFEGRILGIDLPIARRAAALHVPNPRPDRDALIAATALEHQLIVVTRNTADFISTGVPTLNPWESP